MSSVPKTPENDTTAPRPSPITKGEHRKNMEAFRESRANQPKTREIHFRFKGLTEQELVDLICEGIAAKRLEAGVDVIDEDEARLGLMYRDLHASYAIRDKLHRDRNRRYPTPLVVCEAEYEVSMTHQHDMTVDKLLAKLTEDWRGSEDLAIWRGSRLVAFVKDDGDGKPVAVKLADDDEDTEWTVPESLLYGHGDSRSVPDEEDEETTS